MTSHFEPRSDLWRPGQTYRRMTQAEVIADFAWLYDRTAFYAKIHRDKRQETNPPNEREAISPTDVDPQKEQ